MIIHRIHQRTDEWYELKRGRFSASGFSKLMGKKENKGYQDELYRVAYERITGQRVETYTNQAMRDGVENEPFARKYYEKKNNVFVDEVGFIERDEWVGVSPDGLIDNNGMLEIKCPQWNTQIDYLLSYKVPSEYRYQLQGQLWIAEREWVDFLSYREDLDKLEIRVYRDEKIIKELETRVNEAIEEVQEIINKLRRVA